MDIGPDQVGREKKGAHGADIVNGYTKYLSGRSSLGSSVCSMSAYYFDGRATPSGESNIVEVYSARWRRTYSSSVEGCGSLRLLEIGQQQRDFS